MIGRLKHSLKERCPDCGDILQIRIRDEHSMIKGMSVLIEKEYVGCSNKSCYYEREIEQKTRRNKNIPEEL